MGGAHRPVPVPHTPPSSIPRRPPTPPTSCAPIILATHVRPPDPPCAEPCHVWPLAQAPQDPPSPPTPAAEPCHSRMPPRGPPTRTCAAQAAGTAPLAPTRASWSSPCAWERTSACARCTLAHTGRRRGVCPQNKPGRQPLMQAGRRPQLPAGGTHTPLASRWSRKRTPGGRTTPRLPHVLIGHAPVRSCWDASHQPPATSQDAQMPRSPARLGPQAHLPVLIWRSVTCQKPPCCDLDTLLTWAATEQAHRHAAAAVQPVRRKGIAPTCVQASSGLPARPSSSSPAALEWPRKHFLHYHCVPTAQPHACLTGRLDAAVVGHGHGDRPRGQRPVVCGTGHTHRSGRHVCQAWARPREGDRGRLCLVEGGTPTGRDAQPPLKAPWPAA